jgi:hypothetical protein
MLGQTAFFRFPGHEFDWKCGLIVVVNGESMFGVRRKTKKTAPPFTGVAAKNANKAPEICRQSRKDQERRLETAQLQQQIRPSEWQGLTTHS